MKRNQCVTRDEALLVPALSSVVAETLEADLQTRMLLFFTRLIIHNAIMESHRFFGSGYTAADRNVGL